MSHPLSKSRPLTIGVLTPHTGGFYYGAVINGILQAVRKNGAVAIAFETSRLKIWQKGHVLGFQRVDGWLAVNEFNDSELLSELRARAATIVHLHSKPDIEQGSAVLPDNTGGARAVTEHLIAHGHRRIAFAGNLHHVDISERWLGYCAALEAAGIESDAALVFDTPHHKYEDGRWVAETLMAGGGAPRPRELRAGVTALVAATDRLAVGAMRAFDHAGLRVPEDIAIVGFDDSDAAQFAEPPLTTVKQSFPVAAAEAVDELLAAIRQGKRPGPLRRVPAQPVIRRSCGCLPSHSMPPRVAESPEERARGLARELLRIAGRNRLRPVSPSEWPEAFTIAKLFELGEPGHADAAAAFGELWSGFLAQTRDADSVVRAMDLLEGTLRTWGLLDTGAGATWAMLRELRIALLHQWQRAERIRVAHYESVTEAAYRIANSLGHSGSDPSRDLSWIRSSNAYRACCALWAEERRATPPLPSGTEEPSRTRLRTPGQDSDGTERAALCITGRYGAHEGAIPDDSGESISPSEFPPQELLDAARERNAIVSVAGVPSGQRGQYGVLAVVAPLAFEHLEYVGTPGDWGVQLGAALDRAQAERELRASAELDALTGLANRLTLLHRIAALRESAERTPFAVMFIDLDDFKKINDSLGHEAGDRLLVQIASRLGEEVGSTAAPDRSCSNLNLVARVGGDEFVVVWTGVHDQTQATAAVARLQERLGQPYVLEGRTVFVSASIGVNFGQGVGGNAQELLRGADTAMYRAKKKGRAKHEIFHQGMHAQALEKLLLDARLRLALEADELELFYQPIVDATSGRDVGAEALMRWRHPEQGLLSPDRFLPIAEEVGLAIPLSEWTIRRACEQAARWDLGAVAPNINVNVPAPHLKHPGFVEYIEEVLRTTGLHPGRLGLEIVESVLLDEPEKSTSAMRRLRALGVRIAIDDFGTGYSSLSYLCDLPVSTLKVDRSFIQNVPGNLQQNGIVRAIVSMGKELGLSVVAEGIETPAQLRFVQEAGCHFVQGYLLSVPLEEKAFRHRSVVADEACSVG